MAVALTGGTRVSAAERQPQVDALVARLQPLPVSTRRMFGGWGLWLEGRFFGVVDDGVVYFRTDADSRVHYVERGSRALQPAFRTRGPKTIDRNFEVPAEVMADDVLLREWAIRAAAADR